MVMTNKHFNYTNGQKLLTVTISKPAPSN